VFFKSVFKIFVLFPNLINIFQKMLALFILLKLLSLTYATVTPPYYQRITYLSYDNTLKAHNLELKWSLDTAKIVLPIDSSTFTYSIKRGSDSPSDNSNYKIKNNHYFFEKFKKYLLRFDGTHDYKIYVASDISASCSSGVVTVNFKIRLFSCLTSASSYYTDSTSTHKIKLSSDKTTNTFTSDTISLNSNNINIQTLLGVTNVDADRALLFQSCP
jgi:hypothetical protein